MASMTRERLHELIWTKPPQALSALTGISRGSQRYYCKRLGVPMPPRGYFRRGEMVVPVLPQFEKRQIPVVQRNGNAAVRSLKREELYRMVWSEPMVLLAPKLGLSDVGIAKRCRLLQIPVPSRGYWRKVEMGRAPSLPPLPPPPEEYHERCRIERQYLEDKAQRTESAVDLLAKGPAFVRELTRQMSKPAISKRYGISRFALDRFCRQYQIETPPRGYRHPERLVRASVAAVRDVLGTTCELAGNRDTKDVASEAIKLAEDRIRGELPETDSPCQKISVHTNDQSRQLPAQDDFRSPNNLPLPGEGSVDAWLDAFPNKTSNAVRRAHILKGLSAVARSELVEDEAGLARLTNSAIAEICKGFLSDGISENSVRAYRSALKSFRDFLLRRAHGAPCNPETPRSPAYEVAALFDYATYGSDQVVWTLNRDIAIASLTIRDGLSAEEIVAMKAPTRLEQMQATKSTAAVQRYLSVLPQRLRRPVGGPLFVTSLGEPIYRELVGRAVKGLCNAAGVQVRPVAEFRRFISVGPTARSLELGAACENLEDRTEESFPSLTG
ncbi:hypothetical protein OZ411_33675 [Bradyrhizobium sp. Arg237L]|uniref:hypothetical protein n=1 Tax=Bradyrhizobium sp. Arg237L TaxID=3003352 RepID=UPI00249E7D8B|nr:hypothetical protein [Bradyrhizobium sp. Arg237L]MDI4237765.1 hypothetical protein [Bradyrhizobium sp. Arg237L]